MTDALGVTTAMARQRHLRTLTYGAWQVGSRIRPAAICAGIAFRPANPLVAIRGREVVQDRLCRSAGLWQSTVAGCVQCGCCTLLLHRLVLKRQTFGLKMARLSQLGLVPPMLALATCTDAYCALSIASSV